MLFSFARKDQCIENNWCMICFHLRKVVVQLGTKLVKLKPKPKPLWHCIIEGAGKNDSTEISLFKD